MNNKNIKLSDGRNLSYAEYGPAKGNPVFAFHGTPGSRLEVAFKTSLLEEFNIRLIVAERPGYGLSDFQENRSLLDWPDDVIPLADKLHLNHFSTLGFSGGGAYALACAYKYPERVNRVVLASSCAPFNIPRLTDNIPAAYREIYDLAINNYQQVALQLETTLKSAEGVLQMFEASAPKQDKGIYALKDIRQMYTSNIAEAVRNGFTGFAYDIALIAQPWGFDVADIEPEVHIWHGYEDINVPIAMGQYLANTLPRSQAHFVSNAGHMLMFERSEEILHSLLRK